MFLMKTIENQDYFKLQRCERLGYLPEEQKSPAVVMVTTLSAASHNLVITRMCEVTCPCVSLQLRRGSLSLTNNISMAFITLCV